MSSNPSYDSDVCGKVPIHLINTIQPYGALLVIDRSNLVIIQASENTGAIFGLPAPKLVRSSIGDHLDQKSLALLQKLAAGTTADKIPLIWTIGGRPFLVLVHVKESYILVETENQPHEPEAQQSFINVFQEIKYSMALIETADSIEEACQVAAAELRKISGFDKVMIYRFDPDWNGNVIAEEKAAGMDAYLNFTFPASDIPRQARGLYLKNPYRFIPDRAYQPVGLYPVMNPLTRSFIDLSDCNVRGVVAVHLEYLANMGITASMSTRILNNDRLWGLIVCHHRSVKPFSFELCSLFELLSHTISARILSLQNKEKREFVSLLQERYARLIGQIFDKGDVAKGLLEGDLSVLTLFGAGGVLLVSGRERHASGDLPERDRTEELLYWLQSRKLTKNFHSDHLSSDYDPATVYSDVASGLLAIPIHPDKNEYLLLFRPEAEKVIDWGGHPDERIQFEKDELKYHPRNSFRKWRQILKNNSLPWKEEELTVAETMRSFLYEHSNKQA